MNLQDFRKAGHFPSLLCAFLYFDMSFMVWVLVGALAVSISTEFHLDPQKDAFWKGLMIGVPTLGGSILRLVLGVMTDHLGARKTGIIGLILTTIPLLLGWLWASSYGNIIVVGALLGVAGASFAAALPLASRWYPPKYQGLAMGIAGAGNSGTAIATFFGPVIAGYVAGGWHSVFGLSLIPIVLTLIVFTVFAKDSPVQPPPKPLHAYASVLAYPDTWWFCFFYAVTFGGFVGLATFLNTFFKDQYYPDDPFGSLYAARFTTLCVIAGSFMRPVGGYLADRLGGIPMLLFLYAGVALAMIGMAFLPPTGVAVILLFLGMGLLGLGNGSVFQLVPQRFPREIGVITGIVGAAGGFGGFLLPFAFGYIKSATATYSSAFVCFALVAASCIGLMLLLRQRWESTFLAEVKPQILQAPHHSEMLAPANS